MTKQQLTIFFCSLAAVVIYLGYLALSPLMRAKSKYEQEIVHAMNIQNIDPILFEKNLWMQSGRGSKLYIKATRQRMLNDLFKRHHLIGMSRKELEDLLGAGTGMWKPDFEISYPLGYLGMYDDMWLALELKKGVVTKYIVTPD